MELKFDYNNMMSQSIGAHGVEEAEIARAQGHIKKAYDFVIKNEGKGWQEWMMLAEQLIPEVSKLEKMGKAIREKASSFVVLGIGGSALGPLSVATALLHLHHNELPENRRSAPKLYIEDNIDPERMAALLDVIDLKTTYFNVITKSGETSETLSQFLILYDLLKSKVGKENAKKQIIVTTTIGKGTLYKTAVAEGFETYGIGAGVGGRFSVLSNVGLVPFAVMGFDLTKLLNGALEMKNVCKSADIYKNPALMTAFLQYVSMKQGKNISVMMPYADSLKFMSDFYCQLWAESLGKANDLDGKLVNVGQTPAKSLGVTDQHSQVQLYTEGPYDKVIVILAVDKFRKSVTITDDKAVEMGDFLKGHTLNELINAERKATEFALKKANRSNYTIYLPKVDEQTIGELLMYMMMQTAYAGALLNIDTFDQPGVEEGKKATFAMLNRSGYEQKLAEINSQKINEKYII